MGNEEYREEEFLEGLGNGKSIYECEAENDQIDEKMEREGAEE